MVSQEQINQWKQKYEEIFSMPIQGQDYIFRVIGREEYRAIIEKELPLSQQQIEVCKLALLYPEDADFWQLAGIAETLYNSILELSGFLPGQLEYLYFLFQEDLLNPDIHADLLIHEVFPEYKIEEIQNWSPKKLVYYLTRAEWVLTNLRGVPITTLGEQITMLQDQIKKQEQQDSKNSSQQKQQQNHQKPGQLSPKEVEAMLSQKMGQQISLDHESKPDDLFPELAWFKAEEERTGDFD